MLAPRLRLPPRKIKTSMALKTRVPRRGRAAHNCKQPQHEAEAEAAFESIILAIRTNVDASRQKLQTCSGIAVCLCVCYMRSLYFRLSVVRVVVRLASGASQLPMNLPRERRAVGWAELWRGRSFCSINKHEIMAPS